MPLQRKLDPATRGNHFMPIYARLKKGVTLERATAEMRALGQTLAARVRQQPRRRRPESYYEVVVGSVRSSLLDAASARCCSCCSSPARTSRTCCSRPAWRGGASSRSGWPSAPARRDLARQLTTESLLLAAVGGVLGIVLARWMVRRRSSCSPATSCRARRPIAIDGRVLAFTAAMSMLVGVFCGVWPLLRLRPARPDGRRPRGRHADGERRRHGVSATAWSSPRSPSPSHCSSAPACW